MIASFRDKQTQKLFEREPSRKFAGIERIAYRKLLQIDAAIRLEVLQTPPGNRLEALRGSRRGQHSIRINDQYRICFVWREGNAYEVEITDYH